MKTDSSLADLPGGALVQEGLSDLKRGRTTAAACVVEIARSRLTRAGLLPENDSPRDPIEPELRLYRLLRAEPGDAYSRYNSLLRELISFENALDGLMRPH